MSMLMQLILTVLDLLSLHRAGVGKSITFFCISLLAQESDVSLHDCILVNH